MGLFLKPPAPATSATADSAAPARTRLDSVDAVRGLVMVVMALDHVRDVLQTEPYRATDLTYTYPALFLSRIVTHLCAPAFILLAGTAAYLAGRSKSRGALAWFLVTRGLFLVVMELTVIHFFWFQSFDYSGEVQALVIWVIGWCMVLLGGLVFLPTPAVAGLGVLVILQHNLADGILAADAAKLWPPLGPLWSVLHTTEGVPLNGQSTLKPVYVVLPWLGVMCAGYGLGAILTLDRPRRRAWLVGLGLLVLLDFAYVRGLNGYGDPRPWAVQLRDPDTGEHFDPSPAPNVPSQFPSPKAPPTAVPDPAYTAMSFVNCTKYPPSLDFLLMTLGPTLLLLAFFDRPPGLVAGRLVVFGRVPFFFYLLHLPLIVAFAAGVYTYGHAQGWYASLEDARKTGLGVSLGGAYAVWAAVIVLLYFPCRWYADVKRRSRSALLSYL
jgi:uncharacterized membrane protein